MTKTQIVKNAINHIGCGHIPYAINLAKSGFEAHGARLLADYATPQIMKDFRDGRFSYETAISLSLGNHVLNLGCPWWKWYDLPPEYSQPETPDYLPKTLGYGSYEAFFEQLRYLKANYDVYLLVTIWGSHWEKAYFSRGIENFLADIAAEPEYSRSLLETIIRKNLVMMENLLPAGEIDGVLLGSDWGTQSDLIMSPSSWRSLIKEGERQEYELLRRYGKDVFVHSCGNIVRILPDLCELGVQVLNPVQPECMDLAMLKREYGDRLCFWGGISTQHTLPYGSPQDVEREVRAVAELLGEGGGYITAPSQEIQNDVPYENVRTLIQTAKAYA